MTKTKVAPFYLGHGVVMSCLMFSRSTDLRTVGGRISRESVYLVRQAGRLRGRQCLINRLNRQLVTVASCLSLQSVGSFLSLSRAHTPVLPEPPLITDIQVK